LAGPVCPSLGLAPRPKLGGCHITTVSFLAARVMPV
jgi:hypothetical protein